MSPVRIAVVAMTFIRKNRMLSMMYHMFNLCFCRQPCLLGGAAGGSRSSAAK